MIVWDTQTGERIALNKIHGEKNWIKSIAVSPDGQKVLSGAHGLTAKLWDINTNIELASLETSGNMERAYVDHPFVNGVCFMESGERAITANNLGVVQIWDLQTLKELKRFENLGDIRSIQLMPNQITLIVQKASNFYLLDLKTGKQSEHIWSKSVSFARDGEMLVSNQGNLVRMFLVEGLELQETKQYETDMYQTMKCVAVDPSGEKIILGKVANYDHKENRLYDRELYGVESEISKILHSDDEKNSTLVSKDSIRFFNNAIRNFNQNYNDEMIKFFPDGKRYLTVNGAQVNIWDFNG